MRLKTVFAIAAMVVATAALKFNIPDEDLMRVTLKTIKAFRPLLEEELKLNLTDAIDRYTNALLLSHREDEENPGEIIGAYYDPDYPDETRRMQKSSKYARISEYRNIAFKIQKYDIPSFPIDDKDAGVFIAMFLGGYPAAVKYLEDYDSFESHDD